MEGVEILLTRWTRIPFWIIFENDNVRVTRVKNGKGTVRSLRIEGGEARFASRGKVEIKLPEAEKFSPVFPELKVLQIRGLNGGLLEENYHLCHDCFENTGRITAQDGACKKFECRECGNTWTIADI